MGSDEENTGRSSEVAPLVNQQAQAQGNGDSAPAPSPPVVPPPTPTPTRPKIKNAATAVAVPPKDSAAVAVQADRDTPLLSALGSFGDDVLPTNVCIREQLANLPPECLSGDPWRPLRHVDEYGTVTKYALSPMLYSVPLILLVEFLERFCFYGINYTQTLFLTGEYDEDWNAGMASIAASSYVSISTAVAYTFPFLGAYLADSHMGDYWTLLFGSVVFYVPGLILIALTTIPNFMGAQDFNRSALITGLLFLWPVGTGIVKSVVNIFGARQYHPLLQSSLIESYYVKFYMCINIGAVGGGIFIPVMAQHDVTLAYLVPVVFLGISVLVFCIGSHRYVRVKPKSTISKKKLVPEVKVQEIGLFTIFRISVLIIPFCIAYAQMATTFIVQGTVMKKSLHFIDAACMNNIDAVSVLVCGSLIGNYMYPALNRRNIKIPTTYKFAIGSGLGGLAIICAVLVDWKIHATYNATGERISVLWQTFSYTLIGAGEIFVVSAAYEAAFNASPPEKKVLASAVNLFCIGGVPNVLCMGLYHACRGWFLNRHGTTYISRIEDYTEAKVVNYFWLLLGIVSIGIVVNILPPVRDFVTDIETRAAEMVKTPKPTQPKAPPRRLDSWNPSEDDEASPFLRKKRHETYLKYGSGPVLYKQGSMRAGPSLTHTKEAKPIKKKILPKLYGTEKASSGKPKTKIYTCAQGKPMEYGALMKRDDLIQKRTSSNQF